MKIELDTPIEVSETQYYILMHNMQGVIAGRKDGDRYFIKCWLMRYKNIVEKIINNNN